MKILFAGTPTFAAFVLSSLLSSPYRPIAVLTQPDRPAGRGRQPQMSDVKALATCQQINVHQPTRIDPETLELITAYQPDLIIVVAYGLILPPAFLAIPRFGCINLHASLLPRWRGAAPIQRAIAAGDQQTGITLMQMDKGLDTGAMLASRSLTISDHDTSQSLQDRLMVLASELLLDTLPQWPNSPPTPQPQPDEGAVYAHKLRNEEAMINWLLDATTLERQIRAFHPWPGSYTLLADGTRLKIGAATIQPHSTDDATEEKIKPGSILAATSGGLLISTGYGHSDKGHSDKNRSGANRLLITQAQWPGGRMLPMRDLLNGHSKALAVGECLC